MFDPYLAPKFSPNNLDLYYIRSSILKQIEHILPKLTGTLLDVGCGHSPYKQIFLGSDTSVDSYIGIDIPNSLYAKPDVYWDGIHSPFRNRSVDCAVATEVLEHCPNPSIVLDNIYRMLKPGGFFFLTVPFLWPLHTVPYDEFRYTPFALNRLLENAGFCHIEVKGLGGWDASLAQFLGLWVRRRRMRRRYRMILSRLLQPIIFFLYKKDKIPEDFHESSMVTSLAATCIRPND